jgi:hypothetical protein
MRIITATILCLILWTTSAFAALSGGTITTSVVTNTQVLIKITTNPSSTTGGIDTVYVCHIKIGGTDTTFAAIIDSVIVTKLITGMSPNYQAAWFLLVRDTTGKTAISDKDTVTVYSPEKESGQFDTKMFGTEQVITATSWRPYSLTSAFTINGSAGADSSAHYTPWKNNSLIVSSSQAGDSVKVMLYTWYGYRDMSSQTGATVGFASSKDSLNISGEGVFAKTLTPNMAAPVMYFKLQGYAGNGKNSSLQIYLTRDRY